MSLNALLIGGAGTGKTTRLMEVVEKTLERGIDPYEIGFISFTKAATQNALDRACNRFNFNSERLGKDGWFRTLHSFCYRSLEIKSGQLLIHDSADGKKWMAENMGFTPGESKAALDKSAAELTLTAWDLCRQTLKPWPAIHARVEFLPSLKHSTEIIEQYETCKRLNGLSDFTDILGQFAGIWFRPSSDGHLETQPRGWLPHLESLIVDEAQDNSALMDRCLRRIADSTHYGVIGCDPFQSIFGFSGSDHRLCTSWEFQKQEVMPQSHRCARPILELGERCIKPCSDWWDRKIAPAEYDGRVTEEYDIRTAIDRAASDSTRSWMMLCQSNYQLQKFTRELKLANLPYQMGGDGGSPWQAPVRNMALYALMMLQRGAAIHANEWQAVLSLKDLPVKFGEYQIFDRGTKAAWKKRDPSLDGEVADIAHLGDWGATDWWRQQIASGQWTAFIPFAPPFVAAVNRDGIKAINEPRITVSTMHSAKGLEADSVAMLTTTSGIFDRAGEDPETRDEQRRLAYVAVTRAKTELMVISESREKFRMEIPV